MTTILPIATVSESNQREHWRTKAARVKRQRSDTWYGLLSVWGRRVVRLPATITLTRLAPRALDSDNLAASLKAVRDGVADWLAGEYGKGQDRQEGLTWVYAQRKERNVGVEITITPEEQQHASVSQ